MSQKRFFDGCCQREFVARNAHRRARPAACA
jgi:hypothetical protein